MKSSLKARGPTTLGGPKGIKIGETRVSMTPSLCRRGRSSALGLTQATEPFIALLAQKGAEKALEAHPGLAKGVNTRDGVLLCEAVARALGRVA